MSNHFFSSNKGIGIHNLGTGTDDITTATSTTSGDDFELRVADGVTATVEDVLLFLERLEVFFTDRRNTTFPPN